MTVTETFMKGLRVLEPNLLEDSRGVFFKTLHKEEFTKLNLPLDWSEEYFSLSHKNVIRGMHFQVPPEAHCKIVSCLKGSVLDVVIDLRKNSETFGKTFATELNDMNRKVLIIPKGCAHGFLSLQDNSLMFYKVSSIYSPECDMGIRWNSIDFEWPTNKPIVSIRDEQHLDFKEFNSPFN